MSMLEKGLAIADETSIARAGPAATETGAYPVPVLRDLPVAPQPLPAQPASHRKYWTAAGLLVVVLGLALYFQPWAVTAPTVAVETMALAPVTRVLAISGRIAALQSVDLRPLVSGTLAEVLVAEGDVVASSAYLARIDRSAQHAVVRQAMAGLDAALVAQDEAQATFSRNQTLGASAARSELENAGLALQSAAQEVARMTALLDQAQIQYAHFTIRAPMTGTVLEMNVDPGQNVDLSTVLMTIADLSRLEVETTVDEAYATQIELGQPAVLRLAGETAARDGRVSFVSQRVDAATGGLAVKLAFDVPVIAPIALTVTANIIVESRAAAVTLPRAAVVTDGQGTAVFVFSNGVAQRRDVEVIDWPAPRLIVTDGLEAGDEVIADATGVVDGQGVAAAGP